MSIHQNEERRVLSHDALLADVSCWHEPRKDNRLIVNIVCTCGVPFAIWTVRALRFAHCQFKVCGAADVLVGGVCSFHTQQWNTVDAIIWDRCNSNINTARCRLM
jgi:hypothetical protein